MANIGDICFWQLRCCVLSKGATILYCLARRWRSGIRHHLASGESNTLGRLVMPEMPLTIRWSARVRNKVPSSYNSARGVSSTVGGYERSAHFAKCLCSALSRSSLSSTCRRQDLVSGRRRTALSRTRKPPFASPWPCGSRFTVSLKSRPRSHTARGLRRAFGLSKAHCILSLAGSQLPRLPRAMAECFG